MKLTKNEKIKIASEYNLGKVITAESIIGGWVNYNFNFKTDKGNFIIRLMGKALTPAKKKKLQLEFKALKFFDENCFQYETPTPIKTNDGKYILEIGKKNIWAYKKIEGKVLKNLNRAQLKSMVHSLANFHKFVKNFPIKRTEKNVVYGLKKKFNEMKKIKPKNKSDILMIENLDGMTKLLEKISNKKFNENIIPIHLDFHRGNLIYDGNKVKGILDFENMIFAPRIRDIAHLIKTSSDVSEANFIIKEYNKIFPLTKNEQKDVLQILARDCCVMFDYFYDPNPKPSKVSDGGYHCLNWTINTAKKVVKALNWDISFK